MLNGAGSRASVIGACLALAFVGALRRNAADSRFAERALTTGDQKAAIYVQERGQGSPIVVLHGGFGGDQGYLWEIARGREERCRFIFYDQRGSRRSPCRPEDVSFARHVEDLETLRRELDEEAIALVAHSAGVLLACPCLQQHPERVERMVLVGMAQPKWRFADPDHPGGTPPLDWNDYSSRIEAFHERPEIAAEIEKAGLDRESLTARERTDLWRIRFAGANYFHVDRWREVPGVAHFFNPRAGDACRDLFGTRYDFLDALREHVDVPIRVIQGTHDFCDFGGRTCQTLFREDAHVEVIVLQDAGRTHSGSENRAPGSSVEEWACTT